MLYVIRTKYAGKTYHNISEVLPLCENQEVIGIITTDLDADAFIRDVADDIIYEVARETRNTCDKLIHKLNESVYELEAVRESLE